MTCTAPLLASVSVQFRDFGAMATFSEPARTIACLGVGGGSLRNTLMAEMIAKEGVGRIDGVLVGP